MIRAARAAATRLRNLGIVVAYTARRLWAVVRPPLSVVSVLGWIVLGAAVACGVVGWTLGWPEFTFVALTLAAAMLAAVGFLFGRASFGVLIELSPPRVVAGDRAFGRMVVTNTGARRSTISRMELPVGRGVAEFLIPALAPGEEHEELFAIPTSRRAVIDAGPAVSVRGDQLGLLRRTLSWADPVELFVHPVTTRLASSAAGLVRDLEGEVTKTITDNDLSFHALRPYQPGDDRRNVHWRTSARTGQLMVRQFEETRRSQLTMIQSCDRRWYADAAEFELAVSVLASLGVQIVREGLNLSIVTEEHRLRTRTPVALLDDSCRLEPVLSAFSSTREFVRTATARIATPSVVMIVAGSRMPYADIRSIARLYGSDTRVIVFRIEAGAEPRVSRLGEIRVATIGSLDELSRAAGRVR